MLSTLHTSPLAMAVSTCRTVCVAGKHAHRETLPPPDFGSEVQNGVRRAEGCRFVCVNNHETTKSAGLSRCSHVTLLRAQSTTAHLHQGVPGSLWKLGRLNHIAIVVPDMEKATALYRDVLGATVTDKMPLPKFGVYTMFVELGNTKLELIHPLGDKSPVSGFLQKNKSGGMHHICIEVDDINAAIVDLKAKNIRTLSAEPGIGAHGKPVIFLHPKDCDGVLVELEEA
ncbi:methylmalonyl-CoA epimerase, mitochondrial isoform X2 [Brachyistius frenatus]|uniref:methylmalonyl-CoA epimerase, mitochondrial isoform X2 n=1 Tax=Brachyistius frenatus TaxID=100188 RepID=UPI0037E768FE